MLKKTFDDFDMDTFVRRHIETQMRYWTTDSVRHQVANLLADRLVILSEDNEKINDSKHQLKTNKISCEWLVDSFKKMAKELSKYVSRCIFSFITPYSHTLANMPEIIPFTEEEKDWITMRMGVIAISENNLHLQICRLGKEYPGVYVEGCMSPKIFGLNIKPTKASITSGCTCSVQTYGIGEYDTCKMGCKYCYATIDHNLAKRIPENPNSELISGEITEPIKYVNNRVQISQELSLFD